MRVFTQDLSMWSTDNRMDSTSEFQSTSASAEDNYLPPTNEITLPSQPSSFIKSSAKLAVSSTCYLNGDSHGVKVVHHSNGYVISRNHSHQAVKKIQNMGKECQLNGKLYHVNPSNVLNQKEEICCSGQFSTVKTELSTKELIFHSDVLDLSCQLGCGINVSSSRNRVEHMKSCHQSEVAISSSPQNSVYAATLYEDAKRSFTYAEVSECMSIVNKSGDSGEASYSCDFNEDRKTSIYRESTSSGVSEESSSSSLSSALSKPHKSNDVRWEAIQAIRCQSRDGVVDMGHFKLLRKLGYGDIGNVFLAELNGTRTCFAMKVMNKAALASRKKLQRAQTEREILQCLDHPFLPTLYAHFETDESTCLVMEYCPGGDLHALRQKQPGKYFREYAARFYVAEVLLALEYLHMLGIIYRDLKPENVLVREDGHIMLSDFDLSLRCAVSPTLVRSSNSSFLDKNSGYCIEPAHVEPSCVMKPDCIQPACFTPRFLSGKGKKDKEIKLKPEVAILPELIAEPTDARSMSFVGTHEYLAPEIIKGEGHGSAVDWWTFGVFLYELLFGKTPFKGDGNRATLFNVVGQTLRFPESPTVSFAARDLIRGLLVKEPKHRLAYSRGATEIKQHPFFQSINWALIRCTSPPQVPRQALMEFQARTNATKAAMSQKGPGVDVKPSSNYLEIDFF